MEFNLVTNLNSCFLAIQENPPLLYYSHIPTALVALMIGFFVFWKSQYSLAGKILLIVAISFSLWSLSDLELWNSPNSRNIMFMWSWINLLEMLVSVFTLYFSYVFIEKKDVSLKIKAFFGSLLAIFVIFIPTRINLQGFDYDNCESMQGLLTNYYHALEIFFSTWLIIYFIRKIKNSTKGDDRKQIIYLSLGVILFLASFSGTNIYSSLTTNWEILQYGLFGMIVFMGFLAYLIVKYRAFDIKMVGAQALIVGLIVLVASQFAFIQNSTNKILNGIALFLITVFGYVLIKSIKREVAQKDALEVANHEIGERKDQLQKISDHLAVANAKLKELDTAKSEFVSIVAHQLQGPPTTVKGYTMLLFENSYGELTPDQKEILQKIYNANEQQIAFVNDLLNVSRLESGRVVFAFEDCQIENVCQEVVDNLFIKSKNKGLYLDYKKSDKLLPKISVDIAKIREAITNLVDNAIKYTKKGGVSLTVKICNENNNNCVDSRHVRIIVSDTGIGIPSTEIPHLFSKFSRGKDVKRLNAGGTGLGLYVVKMIVNGNKGKVWIESDGEGKGTKFIMELPIV